MVRFSPRFASPPHSTLICIFQGKFFLVVLLTLGICAGRQGHLEECDAQNTPKCESIPAAEVEKIVLSIFAHSVSPESINPKPPAERILKQRGPLCFSFFLANSEGIRTRICPSLLL